MSVTKIKASAIEDYVNPEDLRSDITTVALNQAVTENKTSFNLPNSFIDQFEDETGIDAKTNVTISGEKAGTGDKTALTITNQAGTPAHRTDKYKFGSSSLGLDYQNFIKVDGGASGRFDFGSNNFTIDFWFNRDNFAPWGAIWELVNTEIGSSANNYVDILGRGDLDQYYYARVSSSNVTDQTSASGYDAQYLHNTWVHVVVQRYGTKFEYFTNGTRRFSHTMGSGSLDGLRYLYWGYGHNQVAYGGDGAWDDIRISNIARYTSSSYTVPTSRVTADANTVFLLQSQNQSNGSTTLVDTSPVVNATGNYTSATQTSSTSVSKMGMVILYENAAGTATLNTDIIAQVSADNGSNFTTCTLEDVGNFSANVKIARAVGVSVTAGTQVKYKISFANQSAGSKETRIQGTGLLF
jgi:hypothetical protein|tara:strand:- start:301 stop:1533 length:1233 start_codon:yes stop_codon:yes gene_type:complete